MKKLLARVAQANSLLCVGLDPTGPDADVTRRLPQVIAQTAPFVAAFKPNLAFFLSRDNGVQLLRQVVASVPRDIPIILDGKFGDIANTAEHYARFAYDVVGADAVTVNPYMGDDAIVPFARPDKFVFALAKTSNQPAHSLQDAELASGGPLSELAARIIAELDAERGNIGLVAGATDAAALGRLRQLCPRQWFLVPGVGAQGGDLAAVLAAGLRADGSGLLINASRSIWQAADAAAAARTLRDEINHYRKDSSSAPIASVQNETDHISFKAISSFVIEEKNTSYILGQLEKGSLEENQIIKIGLNDSYAVFLRIVHIDDVTIAKDKNLYKLLTVTFDEEDEAGFFSVLNIDAEYLNIIKN